MAKYIEETIYRVDFYRGTTHKELHIIANSFDEALAMFRELQSNLEYRIAQITLLNHKVMRKSTKTITVDV